MNKNYIHRQKYLNMHKSIHTYTMYIYIHTNKPYTKQYDTSNVKTEQILITPHAYGS